MVSAWKMTAIDYNAIKHVNAGQTLNRKGGLGTGCRMLDSSKSALHRDCD